VTQPTGSTYKGTTVYLTHELRTWLHRIVGQALVDEIPISASDVVRYALERLRIETSEQELIDQLVSHIHAEVAQYPGRAKRGLPARSPAATRDS
jgi:hypothetical protein